MFTSNNDKELHFELLASNENPIQNLVFVINNWQGEMPNLKLNGKDVEEGTNFRQGVEYDVEGNNKLIVFLKYQSENLTKIQLRQKN